MIVFLQPFGLLTNGGGSRILRALLDTEHPPVLSINTGIYEAPPSPATKEIYLPLRRHFGRAEQTRLHPYFGVFDGILRPRFEARLRTALKEHRAEAIHAIPHTFDVVSVGRIASEIGVPFFLSVHDDIEFTSLGHPLLGRIVTAMGEAWRSAKGAFVISEEIGREYSRRYGSREYTIVTDGLTDVPEGPSRRPAQSLHVYFMGLFHASYEPNLRALLDALKIVRRRHMDWDISMTLRCGAIPASVAQDEIPVKVLPFAPESEVEIDMLSADLLYQPLPFQAEAASFGKFSMSTKIVTYLGSGLPIFYHGPENAAACNLLMKHQAAVVCTTLDSEVIAGQLMEGKSSSETIARNALALARSEFMLADQQRRFWEPIVAGL